MIIQTMLYDDYTPYASKVKTRVDGNVGWPGFRPIGPGRRGAFARGLGREEFRYDKKRALALFLLPKFPAVT